MVELSSSGTGIQMILDSVGGMAYIHRQGYAIVWMGIRMLMKEHGYEPHQFYAALKKKEFNAVVVWRKFLETGRAEHGVDIGFGWHADTEIVSGETYQTFHRLQPESATVWGVIDIKDIQFS